MVLRIPESASLQQDVTASHRALIALLGAHVSAAELMGSLQCSSSELSSVLWQLEREGLIQRDLRMRYQLTPRGYTYLVMGNLIPAPASMMPAPIQPKSRPATGRQRIGRSPHMHLVQAILPWILLVIIGVAFFAYGSYAVGQVSVSSALYSDYNIIGCGFGRPSVELVLVIHKPLTVAITGGTAQVLINGIQVGSGIMSWTFSNQDTVQICPSGEGLANSIIDVIQSGHFSYTITGTMDASFFVIISSSVPFTVSGTI
jgi:hypothetical protein